MKQNRVKNEIFTRRNGDLYEKQGIIFDMDGTLWDSAANVAESWNEAIRQDGRLNKALTETDIKGVMGKTMDVIAKLLFPEISEKEQETLLAECCRIENDYLREHGGVLYPDLEDTFKELKKTYELYIVSNCQKGYIEAFLDHYHFWDYFSDIECYGNNLLQKGDNIRLLADRNHLDEAVYVGDIQEIMMPAEKLALDLFMPHTVLESYRKHSIKYSHFQNL